MSCFKTESRNKYTNKLSKHKDTKRNKTKDKRAIKIKGYDYKLFNIEENLPELEELPDFEESYFDWDDWDHYIKLYKKVPQPKLFQPKYIITRSEMLWWDLSQHPNAICLLEDNLDKVCWDGLSLNPNAIHILKRNLHNVNWELLSANPNAIPILEKHPHKIDWYNLSSNSSAIPLRKTFG